MEDVIYLVGEVDVLRDVLFDVAEIWVSGQVGDIFHATGNQVVDRDYVMSFVQQAIAQMRSEETGAAGD
jgi:hypothetical protein